MAAPAILSETPEIYGAEHLLTRRAANPRGRREARRHHQVVGGLYQAQPDGDEQQPLARQQAGRAHHHPREVAGRGRQGRHHHAAPTSTTMPSRSTGKGFVFMDTPGYDPVSATGQVAGGANRHLLHHRPRLGLWLQAGAVDQARHQHRHLQPHDGRHGHQLRRHPRRRLRSRTRARRSSTMMLAVASGERSQVRGAGLWRQRVRALAGRRGDVGGTASHLCTMIARHA